MLIGPDNFTRPPASQRQRWDAEVPMERTPTLSVEWWSRLGGHLGAAVCVFALPVAMYAVWAVYHAR